MTVTATHYTSKLFSKLAMLFGASLLIACSDSDDSTTGPDTQDLPNIVELASSNEDLETLTAAVTAAGLVETLQGEGPFTVFAPTDDAFAALPEGTLDALLADPEGDLKDILLYHVVSGEVKAETVVTLDKATTVEGSDITIEVVDGKVILNGTVMVTATDVMASNGVVHVLDGVILPPEE